MMVALRGQVFDVLYGILAGWQKSYEILTYGTEI